MKTRVRRDFIYRDEGLDINTLLVKANMLGYPYFEYEDNIYFVRCNNKGTVLRPVMVTDNVEEV
jgi:hypothetical protein